MRTKTNRPAANWAGKTGHEARGSALIGLYFNTERHARKPLSELQRLHAMAVRLGHAQIAREIEQLIARKTGGQHV